MSKTPKRPSSRAKGNSRGPKRSANYNPVSKSSGKRSNGFPFTVQSHAFSVWYRCCELYEHPSVTYLIIGHEHAPKSGKKHLQCYVYFRNPKTLNAAMSIIHEFAPNCHVERQSAKKNVMAYCYCMEERDYIEWGERPRQGHRTDLDVIKHDLLSGHSMEQVSLEYFSQWVQYRRSFDEFQRIHKLGHLETTMVFYDPKSIVQSFTLMKELYSYPTHRHRFYHEYEVPGLSQYLVDYHSGKYTHLFVPLTAFHVSLGTLNHEFLNLN